MCNFGKNVFVNRQFENIDISRRLLQNTKTLWTFIQLTGASEFNKQQIDL